VLLVFVYFSVFSLSSIPISSFHPPHRLYAVIIASQWTQEKRAEIKSELEPQLDAYLASKGGAVAGKAISGTHGGLYRNAIHTQIKSAFTQQQISKHLLFS
jgi:hypothetical protein